MDLTGPARSQLEKIVLSIDDNPPDRRAGWYSQQTIQDEWERTYRQNLSKWKFRKMLMAKVKSGELEFVEWGRVYYYRATEKGVDNIQTEIQAVINKSGYNRSSEATDE